MAAAVDTDDRARAAAASAGLAVFGSLAQAVSDRSYSGAVIASPIETHAGTALKCLDAGLAVLVEKPLAQSVADAEAVAQASAVCGRAALVVQNFRYLARELTMQRVFAEGLIGRPLSARVESSRAVGAPAALWDFVVHHLDVFRVRFGRPPESITATQSIPLGLTLTWGDGRRIDYCHDDHATGYLYRERLAGTVGMVAVDDQRVTLLRSGRRPKAVRARDRVDPDQAVLDQFVHAIASAPDVHAGSLSAADNVLTIAMVAAAEEALRLGRTVRIDHG